MKLKTDLRRQRRWSSHHLISLNFVGDKDVGHEDAEQGEAARDASRERLGHPATTPSHDHHCIAENGGGEGGSRGSLQ